MKTTPGDANHNWHPRSQHRTSLGTVRYDSCACGAHRVLLDQQPIAATAAGRTTEAIRGMDALPGPARNPRRQPR